MSLFEEEVIKEYNNIKDFLNEYPNCEDKKCFLDTYYKNEVTRFINLPFNRKVIIKYELKYQNDYSYSITIENIDYNEYAKFNIKVIKMEQGYSKIKTLKYKNELKILKEKYNIKENL